MNQAAIEEAETRLVGLTCRVERHDFMWSFAFQDVCTITVSCPWRLTQDGAVILSRGDDGQRYGLPSFVDCEARANLLLEGAQLARLELTEASADMTATFSNEVRLETFTDSIGYESWQANFHGHIGLRLIVGTGGGGLTTF